MFSKPRGLRKIGNNWYVNFQRDGIRREICAGPKYSQAIALRKELKAGKTVEPLMATEPAQSITYSEAIKEHWENYLKYKKSADDLLSRLKASEKVFGHRRINDITWQEIEQFKNARLEKVQPSVAKKDLIMMSAVFKRQIKTERISTNPVIKVDLPQVFDIREKILTDKEFKKLLNAEWEVENNGGAYKKGLDAHTKLALIIADFTAMRIAEILSMKWSDVDLENGYVFVPLAKNNCKRMVPIHDELRKILLESRTPDSEYVVNFRGRKVDSIRKGFRKARAKVDLSDLWIHDFRHRAITRWVQAGYPPNVIMKATGHKTYSAFNRYANLRGDDVQVLVGRKKAPLPIVTYAEFKKVG